MKRVFIFLACLVTASCNFHSEWKDGHINPETKAVIDELNQKLMHGFSTNQAQEVLSVCSDTLIKASKNDLVSLMRNVSGAIKPAKFEILNQYDLKNFKENYAAHAISGLTGEHDYDIGFLSITKEAFVTVGIFNDSVKTIGMLTIFGKYGNDWKLNILRIGVLKVHNMDAYDWYERAKEDRAAGDLIDAVNKYTIAAELLKPFNDYLTYRRKDTINALGAGLKVAVHKTFSFPIHQMINGKNVGIFRVTTNLLKEGYFPEVIYTTTIPFADTSALSEECTELHHNIGPIFPGLDKRNTSILYRVFQKIPASDTDLSYGLIRSNNL